MERQNQPESRGKVLRKLFFSTLYLSAFTFGGGYVIVTLMKKKFVDSLHWIDEDEMLDLTAIAQSAPGPIAVNASILVGYRVAGAPGAALTILGTVLPPFLILSAVSLFYEAFRSNRIVAALLRGMQAGVAAVICSVVVDMAGSVLKEKKVLSDFLMAAVFLVTLLLPKLNVIWIILACAGLGVAAALWGARRNREAGKK